MGGVSYDNLIEGKPHRPLLPRVGILLFIGLATVLLLRNLEIKFFANRHADVVVKTMLPWGDDAREG